ncbi:MAG: transcriptional regulator [Candidatus Bathyarchaeia archaeon]|nr:transcriptional regulator [Candidatus Bathyarchaeota archaeon]
MSEIPLSPVGREQIHKLEAILLVNSILRPEVLEELRNPEERITWVDSLAVAAAALAREKAKMTIPRIAEELGRTETTIRNHLQGKTRAGQIVRETYEKIAREGITIMLPQAVFSEEVSRLKSELENERKKREEVEKLLDDVRRALTELLDQIGR